MRIRSTILSTGLNLALVTAVAVGSAWAQRIPPKDTLRVVSFDVKVLDPHFGGGGTTEFFSYKVYDMLFSFDSSMKPQPQMVDTYAWNGDNTKLTMTLRPDLHFHDGTPIRAADAVASLIRWGAGPRGRVFKRLTKSVETVDDKTFVWNLKVTNGMALEILTGVRYPPAIMPERLAKTPVKEKITDFTGSGPFVFLPNEYIPGKQLHYVKFEGYNPRSETPTYVAGSKKVYFKRLEEKIITDEATMVAALKNGEVDLIQEAPASLRDDLIKDPNITLAPLRTGRQGLIYLNHLAPPFNHPAARQALLWMINQEEMLTGVVGDPKLFKVCPAYWTCGGPYATDVGSEALMGQDFEKAKRLMKEAGYNGEPIVILTNPGSASSRSTALIMSSYIRKIGGKADMQEMNYGAMMSRRRNKDNPITNPRKGWHMMPLATQTVTPSLPALTGFLSGGCEKGFYGWPCDKRIDDLKLAFGNASDGPERMKIAIELQKAVYETVPYIQFGEYANDAAFRKNISGIVRAPSPIYWSVKKN